MDEVAKVAGISRATPHRQFAGRDALVRALEALGIAECEAALGAARLDEGAGARRRTPARPRARARRRTARLPLHREPAVRVHREPAVRGRGAERGRTRIDERIAALFRRGRQSGEFRIDLTPPWLTEALFGLLASGARAVSEGRAARNDFTHMIVELLPAAHYGERNHDQHPAAGVHDRGGEAPGPPAGALRPRARRAAGGRRRDRPRSRDPLHQRGPEALRHPSSSGSATSTPSPSPACSSPCAARRPPPSSATTTPCAAPSATCSPTPYGCPRPAPASRVAAGRSGAWLWTAVRDEGPGNLDDDQARVFDQFRRARGTGGGRDRHAVWGSPSCGRSWSRTAGRYGCSPGWGRARRVCSGSPRPVTDTPTAGRPRSSPPSE
jgi:TetR/AcrR family transcriptional repressor of mexCD-oprJ operon